MVCTATLVLLAGAAWVWAGMRAARTAPPCDSAYGCYEGVDELITGLPLLASAIAVLVPETLLWRTRRRPGSPEAHAWASGLILLASLGMGIWIDSGYRYHTAGPRSQEPGALVAPAFAALAGAGWGLAATLGRRQRARRGATPPPMP